MSLHLTLTLLCLKTYPFSELYFLSSCFRMLIANPTARILTLDQVLRSSIPGSSSQYRFPRRAVSMTTCWISPSASGSSGWRLSRYSGSGASEGGGAQHVAISVLSLRSVDLKTPPSFLHPDCGGGRVVLLQRDHHSNDRHGSVQLPDAAAGHAPEARPLHGTHR